jgi:hypothetical protein
MFGVASLDVQFHPGIRNLCDCLRRDRIWDAVRTFPAVTVITVATAVVGTASALVLGLLISTASTAFMQRGGHVVRMATDIIRVDQTLQSYGPSASTERQEFARYASFELDDLLPDSSRHARVIDNPASSKG